MFKRIALSLSVCALGAAVLVPDRLLHAVWFNPRGVALPYRWRSSAPFFSVQPECGSVPAGASQEFALRFAPLDSRYHPKQVYRAMNHQALVLS